MEVKKIIIENFKGIKRVELSPIKPVNVLIGRNNAGKTSVLQALEYVGKCWDQNGNMNLNNAVKNEHFSIGLSENSSVSIEIYIDQLGDVIGEVLKKIGLSEFKSAIESGLFDCFCMKFVASIDDPILLLRNILMPFKDEWCSLARLSKRGNNNRGRVQDSYFYQTKSLISELRNNPPKDRICQLLKSDQYDGPELSYNFAGPQKSDVKRISTVLTFLREQVKKYFMTSVIVPSIRHADPTGAVVNESSLSVDGKNLVSNLACDSMNNRRNFRKINTMVQSIWPELGELHSRILSNNVLELACEWEDGEVINLDNVGDGVEQFLIITKLLLDNNRGCWLWEEPEVHLHPGAQESLIDLIQQYIGNNRLFLTTHSPVFIRPSDVISVHAIKNYNGRNATGYTISNDDLQEICDLIGSRPGHLAQADIVLYVEGKYGVPVIEEWIQKWPDCNKKIRHLKLIVQSFNASEVSGGEFDILKIKKVNPNIIFFVDNDADLNKPDEAINPSRQRLKDLCDEHTVPCIITDYSKGNRQIEDFFTPEAIRDCLPANLLSSWDYDSAKSMSQQFHNGWKKHNRKIARNMKWEDIDKHEELLELFTEIEKIAARLLPNGNGN